MLRLSPFVEGSWNGGGQGGNGGGQSVSVVGQERDGRSKTREKILEKSEREEMLPRIQRWSLSKNIIFPAALYCSWRSGCPVNWLASAMRGAKSEGKRSANERDESREKAGGDAGGVLGAGHG